MKTAWIFPGGAARAVYTAGAIYALCNMKISKPDIIIAASGSAPTSICYITNQYEIIPKVWLEYLSTRKFVNFFRFWKIVDIDYLIDDVLKNRNPLDMNIAKNSGTVAYFPLTDSKTGEIKYLSNKDESDLWEVVKASVSVPIFTNLFSVLGNSVLGHYYCDTAPSSRFEIHVKKAITEGAQRIVVFDNWHTGDNKGAYFFSRLFACVRNSVFKKNQLDYIKEIKDFTVPNNVEFIKILPKEQLGMGRFEIDNKNAKKIFWRGYEDTLHNEQLKEMNKAVKELDFETAAILRDEIGVLKVRLEK